MVFWDYRDYVCPPPRWPRPIPILASLVWILKGRPWRTSPPPGILILILISLRKWTPWNTGSTKREHLRSQLQKKRVRAMSQLYVIQECAYLRIRARSPWQSQVLKSLIKRQLQLFCAAQLYAMRFRQLARFHVLHNVHATIDPSLLKRDQNAPVTISLTVRAAKLDF
jgi:hypothetical protein